MKAVIVYFGKKTMISTVQEGVDFINGLQYRGNSYSLSCNENCKSKLEKFLNGEFEGYSNFEMKTTGCGVTKILIYPALADNIAEHDKIVEERKMKEAEARWQKKLAREAAIREELNQKNEGYYVVTVTGTAFKTQGSDGPVTKSVKVLADSQLSAYEKAVNDLQSNPPRNVMGWYNFESAENAMIEYVGVWTDSAQMEYGS